MPFFIEEYPFLAFRIYRTALGGIPFVIATDRQIPVTPPMIATRGIYHSKTSQ
jgi:hypothetical protein